MNTRNKSVWSNNIKDSKNESKDKNRNVTIDIDTDINNLSFEGHLVGDNGNNKNDSNEYT